MQSCKPKVTDLNPHLLCVLCSGYFVDATTVIECLHSFCRSCIVKYLERNKYCPICDVLVHKSKPLSNIRPDHTLQNIVYKLVPRLFQREMLMRRDFYSRNKVYIPRDPMSRGDVPDNYHIFSSNDKISVCLYYECDQNDEKNIQKTHKRYLWCPASLTIITLKKLVYLKYELTPDDHHVEIFYQNSILDDQLTLMDVIYMFDWKRKDPLTITYQILKVEVEPVQSDVVIKEENSLAPKKDDEKSIEENDLLQRVIEKTEIHFEDVSPKIEEKATVADKIPDSKEVQLEISENGVMKITNINQSREAIQANVTLEPTDEMNNEKLSKCKDTHIKDDHIDVKKKTLKVYPGSKIKKTKPKLDTIVEKIKKQGTKYKTLTSPTNHWNPSISKNSVLAKKKEINGVDKKCQKFFKSRDDNDKKDEDKTEESLKRLAEVPLMKINPQTLCPILPTSPAKKPKKPTPKKNTLAHSLALLPVRPTNHNPFTNPLNPFMYGTFSNNSDGNSGDPKDFLKAISELRPPSSAYHNSLPPSVSVLFNPLYAHHRQCLPKKATTIVAQSPDVQKLHANKGEEKTDQTEDISNGECKDKDECTNNNKGEEKMDVEKEKT
ncbi:Zinc finger, RING-type,Zinc finger, RING/FYVE/PHD-type,Zinc finger, RING-type, conserved [Cinara cedri]|uniref:Zinc finger, RING-type,Zinc finger, RING/FYVE/PHD-type,Zinc finger, RING-type, conserved n=1 Tax=Cinara cedri TaxID=506608 RepID=A0A5E4N5C9_9HEMI|nr:Zinc finger, RING-type,Zinc finger, RING/FYVE/PHD-type,Zinc finger, RING-type, conserved [Cinara cedri]